MSAHHMRFGLILSIMVGSGAAARAQALDVSRPLEEIEDLPVLEKPATAEEDTAAKLKATTASAEWSALLNAEGQRSLRRVLSSIERRFEFQIGADIDDSKRFGSYVDTTGKFSAASGSVLLLPELTVRGDNLSSAAMESQGLRVDGALGLVLAPSSILENRLRFALAGDGWYMATRGTDARGVAVAAKTSIRFCPPIVCRDGAGDDEAIRVGASFSSATAGADKTGLELAYALQWTYREAIASNLKPAPERVSATPILTLKHTDMGWATTLGLDLGIDLSLALKLGVQLRRTIEGGAATSAATLGGLFVAYHPGG